jgi:hypothetical protein
VLGVSLRARSAIAAHNLTMTRLTRRLSLFSQPTTDAETFVVLSDGIGTCVSHFFLPVAASVAASIVSLRNSWGVDPQYIGDAADGASRKRALTTGLLVVTDYYPLSDDQVNNLGTAVRKVYMAQKLIKCTWIELIKCTQRWCSTSQWRS